MEKKLKNCENEIKELKKDYAQEKEEKKKIEEKRKSDNKNSNDHMKELMAKKRNVEKEREELKEVIKSLTEEKSDLESNATEQTRKYDEQVEKANGYATEIERLVKEVNENQSFCKSLEEEIIKCKSFTSSTLLPSEKDFQMPGAISILRKKESAKVVATRSSEGPGEANDVLDHQSYKKKRQSCGTAEEKNSWWCVDLGDNYLLFLTHYSLRHGEKEATSIVRNWKVEGSIDGKDWKEIKTEKCKRNDQFKHPYPYYTGTWPVKGEVGAFRYFKIVQTGRNSSRKYGMYLYGIEFYGVLIKN